MTRGKHVRPRGQRAGLFTRWRRRHTPPFDWAEQVPEMLLPRTTHVRLVAGYPMPNHPYRRRP